MTKSATSTEALFNDISRFISDSRSLLESGQMMELAGLDDQVRVLCDAVLRLSQDDRLSHADRLQQLLGDLKQLGDEMVEQREKLGDKIRGVPQFKNASVAYRKVEAIDTSGDDDEDE